MRTSQASRTPSLRPSIAIMTRELTPAPPVLFAIHCTDRSPPDRLLVPARRQAHLRDPRAAMSTHWQTHLREPICPAPVQKSHFSYDKNTSPDASSPLQYHISPVREKLKDIRIIIFEVPQGKVFWVQAQPASFEESLSPWQIQTYPLGRPATWISPNALP